MEDEIDELVKKRKILEEEHNEIENRMSDINAELDELDDEIQDVEKEIQDKKFFVSKLEEKFSRGEIERILGNIELVRDVINEYNNRF